MNSKNQKQAILYFCLAILLLSACGPSQQEINDQIAFSVVATISAIPSSTPFPTPTPYPTLKPQLPDLTDLFCEYEFCIGHPPGAYLVDLDAPDEWSSHRSGGVIGFEDEIMFVYWITSSEANWNPTNEVDELLGGDEVAQSDFVEETMGDFTVIYQTYSDPSSNVAPYGVNAAWYCGNRGFTALIEAKREERALELLRASISSFICKQ